MNYAKIDENGIVIEMIDSEVELKDANLIPVDEGAVFIGYRWNGSEFESLAPVAVRKDKRFYVQVDQNGIVVAMTETSGGEIVADNVIEVDDFDATRIGKRYENGSFVDVPKAPEFRTRLTKLEFRRRFTLEELSALYTAGNTNVMLKIWLDDLTVAEYIDVSDPRLIAGVQGLVSLGFITAERASEILAPQAVV